MGTSRRIIMMLLMVLCLMAILISMASWYYKGEREHCFAELNEYADSLAQEIQDTVKKDQEWLSRVAQVAVKHGPDLDEYAPELFELTDGIGQFTRMELILPDGSVLLSTGERTKTDLSVSELAKKGPSISRRMADPMDSERMILQAYMPIIQNRDGMMESDLTDGDGGGYMESSVEWWIFPFCRTFLQLIGLTGRQNSI